MANVLEIIKNEITQDYYKNNFPNDGQRFVAWYMRNIHLLDQRQAKDAITDGANDKQIDAVYIDEDEQKIYIVQGKYYLGESVDATPVREVISAWSQFSNLAQLQENANSKLKTKISEIATALEDDSYWGCTSLRFIILGDYVETIGAYAFYGASSINISTLRVTLPASVKSIGDYAFHNRNVEFVYCKSLTPPFLGGANVFGNDWGTSWKCKYYVPMSAVDDYKKAPYWKDLGDNIVGYDFTE